jgi:hypothetical protein
MDRHTILEHLAQVRRQVAEAKRHIAHQRVIIAEEERDGQDGVGRSNCWTKIGLICKNETK